MRQMQYTIKSERLSVYPQTVRRKLLNRLRGDAQLILLRLGDVGNIFVANVLKTAARRVPITNERDKWLGHNRVLQEAAGTPRVIVSNAQHSVSTPC